MSVSAPEMTATKIKELVSVQPYSITLITTFIHYELSSDSLCLSCMIYFCDLFFKIYERVEKRTENVFCLFVLIHKVLLSYICTWGQC